MFENFLFMGHKDLIRSWIENFMIVGLKEGFGFVDLSFDLL